MDDRALLAYLDRLMMKVEECNLNEEPVPIEVIALIRSTAEREGGWVAGLDPLSCIFRIQNRVLRRRHKVFQRVQGVHLPQNKKDPEDD